MFYEVIPTEVYRAGGGALTYSFNQKLRPGHIVLIPLGKRTITGIILKKVPRVDFPTKPIIKLLHPLPLPGHLLKSILWLSKYYLSPLPACANLMLPAGLTSKTVSNQLNTKLSPKTSTTASAQSTKSNLKTANPPKTKTDIPLNSAQKTALKTIANTPGNTALLRGVTGSGKTNIYLQKTSETLQSGKSVILLVPEIALTSQLVKIFSQTFGDRVVLIHSNQTLVERRQTWLTLLEKTYPLDMLAVQGLENSPASKETKRSVKLTAKNGDLVKTGVDVGFLSKQGSSLNPEPLTYQGDRFFRGG